MLRTPHFYMLYVMFVAMSTGGLLATAQPGPLAKAWGLPIAALTLATTISPLANGGSRIFWGWVSDRTGRENAMVLHSCCRPSVFSACSRSAVRLPSGSS